MRVSTEDIFGWFTAVALSLGRCLVGDWQDNRCFCKYSHLFPNSSGWGRAGGGNVRALRLAQAAPRQGLGGELGRTWASRLVYPVLASRPGGGKTAVVKSGERPDVREEISVVQLLHCLGKWVARSSLPQYGLLEHGKKNAEGGRLSAVP